MLSVPSTSRSSSSWVELKNTAEGWLAASDDRHHFIPLVKFSANGGGKGLARLGVEIHESVGQTDASLQPLCRPPLFCTDLRSWGQSARLCKEEVRHAQEQFTLGLAQQAAAPPGHQAGDDIHQARASTHTTLDIIDPYEHVLFGPCACEGSLGLPQVHHVLYESSPESATLDHACSPARIYWRRHVRAVIHAACRRSVLSATSAPPQLAALCCQRREVCRQPADSDLSMASMRPVLLLAMLALARGAAAGVTPSMLSADALLSLAKVGTQPGTAARTTFERGRSSAGCPATRQPYSQQRQMQKTRSRTHLLRRRRCRATRASSATHLESCIERGCAGPPTAAAGV
eukprot:363337-Chlamydomonas_euryale.AAC.4